MLTEALIRISDRVPGLPLDSATLRYVKKLEPSASPQRYAALALLLAIFAAGILTLAFLRVEVFLLAFAGFFFLILQLPRLEFRRRVAEIERELPFALRDLGILLGLRIPFARCIGIIADGNGVLAREFRTLSEEMERGAAFSKTLGQQARFLESPEIARACAQLISAYEEGANGKEIRRLGDELLAHRRYRLREYANRSAILGLLFLVSTAILPTFFLVVVGLGGTFTTPLSPTTIRLITLVVFPLLTAVVLLTGKAMMPDPVFSTSAKGGYMSFVLAVPLLAAASLLHGALLYILLLLLAVGIVLLLYPGYRKQRKQEEIERALPDALLIAASLPKGSTIERVFESFAEGGYGALSEEARVSLRQLHAKVKPEEAMHDFETRNPEGPVVRTFRLLRQAFLTNRLDRLHEIAEDLLKDLEIKRERQALLGIQKYTLLLGAILVPLILKSTMGLLMGMATWTGTGGAVDAMAGVLPAYVVLYALLGSYYLADLEKAPSQSILYFGAMGIMGLLVLQLA